MARHCAVDRSCGLRRTRGLLKRSEHQDRRYGWPSNSLRLASRQVSYPVQRRHTMRAPIRNGIRALELARPRLDSGPANACVIVLVASDIGKGLTRSIFGRMKGLDMSSKRTSRVRRATLVVAFAAAFRIAVPAQSFATTNYVCMNACSARGQLYQACLLRCSDGAPPPAPQTMQSPPLSRTREEPAQPLQPSQTNQSFSEPSKTEPGQTRPIPSAASPATVAQSNQKCLLRCTDRGHLYHQCAQSCSK